MLDLNSRRKAFSHLDNIDKIALQAGELIMKVYQKGIKVHYKTDLSPVTEADLSANQIILDALKKIYPDIPVLTEEEVSDFEGPNLEGYYWLVDPLDGTKEFVIGNGEFTVNIALIYKGEPILGVVYAPAKNIMYRAVKGYGAFKREKFAAPNEINVIKHKTGSKWKVVISRSHLDIKTRQWLEKIGPCILTHMGSSLKICLVAEGLAHIYPRLGFTSLWDTAAAHVILKEAGGEIKDLDGHVLNYKSPNCVLNPFFIASSNKDSMPSYSLS
jgi:3'(2'), 5'-bisphosphate nucleotidase